MNKQEMSVLLSQRSNVDIPFQLASNCYKNAISMKRTLSFSHRANLPTDELLELEHRLLDNKSQNIADDVCSNNYESKTITTVSNKRTKLSKKNPLSTAQNLCSRNFVFKERPVIVDLMKSHRVNRSRKFFAASFRTQIDKEDP